MMMSHPLRGCPLCGGHGHTPLGWATAMTRPAFGDSGVVRCSTCALDYIHPVPSTLDGVYEEDYFRAYAEAGMVFPTEASLHPRYFERLRTVEAMGSRGRLLEIGVGHGAFLSHAAAQGWDVTGVEVSKYAAAYVKQRHGLNVICGSIETADVPDHGFDFVHLSHVLEHLLDPLDTLRRIRRLLSNRGVLALEVPNELENLHVRLSRAGGLLRPYAVRCTHVCFFTPATLRRMLVAAGFRVRRLRTLRDDTDPKLWRRTVKRVAGSVERAMHRGALIEAFATREEGD